MSQRPQPIDRWVAWTALLLCAVIISAALAALPHHQASAAETKVTTVSLSWDDGRASQIGSVALQQTRGFAATYFLSSNLIGTDPYYLDRAAVDLIHAAGNEIGGHGDAHVDLTTVDIATATRLICADRSRAVSWYADAGRSFAYPFGSYTAALEAAVAGCGYTSGRVVGGIRTASSCQSCPPAETIPPADPYALRTTSSVRNTTTLGDLQALVNQGDGGWVMPIFHDLGGTGTYSIDPGLYGAFLDWLAARPNTVVRTVGEVIAGGSTGTTSTSSSSTSSSSSSTSSSSTSSSSSSTSTSSSSSSSTSTTIVSALTLANAGLETDSNGDRIPDCWVTNSGIGNGLGWSRTSGHTGRRASQVNVWRYNSGDVWLASDPACAPAVNSGTFEFGVWYTSTAPTRIIVERRNSAGTWTLLATGPALSARRSWTKALLTVTVPGDTTAVRFGLTLRSTGQLVTDDYSIVKK